MSRILPPGLTATALDQAFARFAQVVGRDWMFTSQDDRDSYLDPFAPGEPSTFAAAGAVAPASVDEVRAVVRVANELGVPLWTVSAGKNLAYGGAAPRMAGSVVLDLKRMRAIEVNEDLAYAVVEPGVTFFDLNDHLKAHGHKLWISSPAPGWGSVMGNALEHGFGPTAHGDHAAQMCGLEVVLADGDVVRTGMGAAPGAQTFNTFKGGFGPAYDSMFLQSNFGVVTKMGIWLMPEPEGMVLCEVKFPRESDLEAAVDVLRPLRLKGVIPSIANMRNALGVAAGSTSREQWWDKPGPLPDAVISEMMRKLNIGWWNMSFALYGPPQITSAQLDMARAAFGVVPGAELTARTLDLAALARPDRGGGGSRAGIPGLAAFQLANWRGGAGAHVDFSPIFPPHGADAVKLYKMARSSIEGAGLDFIGTYYNFGRTMALICAVVFDRRSQHDTAALKGLFGRMIVEAGAAGYGEYRTHLAYMDEVAAQYSWNDHALMRLSQRIKSALDPKGILSPGKQGIWPARRRRASPR
jgi:4-cresol dehydrogenase (hydroxylating)